MHKARDVSPGGVQPHTGFALRNLLLELKTGMSSTPPTRCRPVKARLCFKRVSMNTAFLNLSDGQLVGSCCAVPANAGADWAVHVVKHNYANSERRRGVLEWARVAFTLGTLTAAHTDGVQLSIHTNEVGVVERDPFSVRGDYRYALSCIMVPVKLNNVFIAIAQLFTLRHRQSCWFWMEDGTGMHVQLTCPVCMLRPDLPCRSSCNTQT